MALACQKDSYLKELVTNVKSCTPGELKQLIDGKTTKLTGFEVELNDTVLFPEGGGQPSDRGTIGGHEVLSVVRRGAAAIHFLTTPLNVGDEVHVVVDWERRWDHMQQHSGQHLITALASTVFGFDTTSWNLGERTSSIELNTASMSNEQIDQLERLVNEKIVSGARMYPTLFDSKLDPSLENVRTRGLPDDHVGAVRLVTIEGIEANMCCGTHVSNLAHLQAVKLLYVEAGKKGRTNLVFEAGNRVLRHLASCCNREKVFTQLLKGGPSDHVELLKKLQNSYKVAQKNALVLLRECAKYEAERFKAQAIRPPVFILHKKEGDNEFMNTIVNEIADENVLMFLTSGEDVGQGLFLLSGREEQVTLLAPRIAEIMDGKGAGKKGKYQGKCNKIQRRNDAEKVLLNILDNN